ncbi:Phytanoyl-CoA dioxygenase [Strigomonas culicis]|uniref:Phytanoyl-CoA dioxygenase n=1 Tax=Strigomonas culicis TaxID=28005 RepID=S9V752_9TRYP|nr:Phytanoyl-CoA dioxygenase [Strigomonas culicis]EPY21337.1 Phytanoyl-CoA dioxygenase [Strigomonas culicis]EPY22796.1 Phytanoyl-CoA dioxygenase [Strigomonas culicis]EPY32900.1 Phytanoyl-CoA dioxygenase [Strigomonas culicis]|eukprot:EPY20558.1 Phytanoyl-CoA dioxygenase [Strigomonas culicis]
MRCLKALRGLPLAAASAMQTACRRKSYVLKYLRGRLPEDLKDVSGALGCLYGALPDVDEYSAFVLPLHVIEEYHQMGFVKLPRPVLDARQVDVLTDEAEQLANNVEHHPKLEYLYATTLANFTDGPLFNCQGQWRASWGMHDLVYLPYLTVAASQALGNAAVHLWYDEVLIKAARVGPCIPWRQNYALWSNSTTPSDKHVSLFVALDHLNKDRGAPCLVPGSHRWRTDAETLLHINNAEGDTDEARQLNTIWSILREEETEVLMDSPPMTLDLQRGEAVLIHPLTLYATHGNRSLGPARSCAIHFVGDGAQCVRNGPLLPNTTQLFQAGQAVGGPFFPTVFDPAVVEGLPLLNQN